MFVMILTLSADFLATVRALALELPTVTIDTARVQEWEFKPHITREEAERFAETYRASHRYDKVEIIYREG